MDKDHSKPGVIYASKKEQESASCRFEVKACPKEICIALRLHPQPGAERGQEIRLARWQIDHKKVLNVPLSNVRLKYLFDTAGSEQTEALAKSSKFWGAYFLLDILNRSQQDIKLIL